MGWPQLKVSSDRLVKPEIEPANPGLQGQGFIHFTTAAPLVLMSLRPHYINMTDPWSYFWIIFGSTLVHTLLLTTDNIPS